MAFISEEKAGYVVYKCVNMSCSEMVKNIKKTTFCIFGMIVQKRQIWLFFRQQEFDFSISYQTCFFQ